MPTSLLLTWMKRNLFFDTLLRFIKSWIALLVHCYSVSCRKAKSCHRGKETFKQNERSK